MSDNYFFSKNFDKSFIDVDSLYQLSRNQLIIIGVVFLIIVGLYMYMQRKASSKAKELGESVYENEVKRAKEQLEIEAAYSQELVNTLNASIQAAASAAQVQSQEAQTQEAATEVAEEAETKVAEALETAAEGFQNIYNRMVNIVGRIESFQNVNETTNLDELYKILNNVKKAASELAISANLIKN